MDIAAAKCYHGYRTFDLAKGGRELSQRKKSIVLLCCLVAAVFVCMLFAHLIETDFGGVEVSTLSFESDKGTIVYKLYRPAGATAENPAPAVLLLHGYQNDKETDSAYAIELARRGIVAMAIDEYGHGATSVPMRERGSTHYKYPNFEVTVSGPERYLVMMNFSNLDFFYDEFSEGLEDTSMGGKLAYSVLGQLDFVDADNIGITGHSMGTWASWSTAAEHQNHKCIVLQCGELFDERFYDADSIRFNNVLLLQAKYDEFNYFRDYQNTVDGLENTPLRYNTFCLQDGPVEWNTTYGSFEDGTARCMELLATNHRLVTYDPEGMAAALDWFCESLSVDTALAATDLVYMTKELLMLAALVCAVLTMLPLMKLVCALPFFKRAVGPLPSDNSKLMKSGAWARAAVIMLLLSGLSYPFMTQLGHGLLPLPENVFRMTIGNGYLSWYLLLTLILAAVVVITFKRSQKLGDRAQNFFDLGLSGEEHSARIDFGLMGRSALLALVLTGFVYLLTALCALLFGLDLRFIWPFLKTFTGERFLQFLVYLPIFAVYFLMLGVRLFGQMRRPRAGESGAGAFVSCWLKNCLAMAGGLVLVTLVEYIPFFAGAGPGADLLFGTTFGGPFMSLLIVLLPQVLAYSALCTWFNRNTGRVYVGAFVSAVLSCWILTAGSSMF